MDEADTCPHSIPSHTICTLELHPSSRAKRSGVEGSLSKEIPPLGCCLGRDDKKTSPLGDVFDWLRDLSNLHLREELAVSGAAGVAALGLVLHNLDLLGATMSHDLGAELGRKDRRADLHLVSIGGQKNLKLHGLAGFGFELFDAQNMAFLHEVLFPTGFDDSNHIVQNGLELSGG